MKHNKDFKKNDKPEEKVGEKAQEQQEAAQAQAEEQVADTAAETADALAEAQKQAAEAQDKYLRLAAEFDNYRRRTSKEKLDLVKSAGEDILKGMLPVLDDCERAIKQLEQTEASTFEKEGTGLIYNKLLSYMKSCGLEEIEVVGKEFDTDFAEAVAQLPVEDSKQKGTVLEVIQKGYILGGKVIRFAKVVVGV
ncbi:MAG: nucleotide exchange factor GrpE [Bacteroidales bacterium]|nr:nucleotide exchange factor GrpE [Bacteroidales bacterium]